MAKPAKQKLKGQGPPDPSEFDAFEKWLERQPREWSVVIAARAALRVLPLVGRDKNLAVIILPVFRATAIARFAAKYPNRAIDAASDASGADYSTVFSVYPASARDAAYAAHSAAAAAAARDAYAAYAAAAYAASATATASTSASAAIWAAVKDDARQLYDEGVTPFQLADAPLWRKLPPPRIGGVWEGLKPKLHRIGRHWSIWIDWYDDVRIGERHSATWDVAFTDVLGKLPWDDGAKAVNTEIALRLRALREGVTIEAPTAIIDVVQQKEMAISRLAEVASPQPSITDTGQLDAGPNKPFDVPEIGEDLSTLPLRQRNLISGILGDLPRNAPAHLKRFLESYDAELKTRGAQPILGILKDDADIIAAAVAAPRAEDEWLEAGMRKAFDRFAENHTAFVEHFPLDAEREAVYAQTPLDESKATGKDLEEPLEAVTKATEEAHKAGAVTDDFLAVVNSINELGRAVASLPPQAQQAKVAPEIKVSREDRIAVVSVKKRTILGALGFYQGASKLIDERTVNLTAAGVTIAQAVNASGLSAALRHAIEALLRFLI